MDRHPAYDEDFYAWTQDQARLLQADCPYDLDQLLDEDWWPANRHDLD